MKTTTTGCVVLLGLLASVCPATTIYVNGTTGDDAWNGLCEMWNGGNCGPKRTIQAAIDAAGPTGDTVLLADGVYTGAGNVDLQISNKGLTLRSSGQPEFCVIDLQDATYGLNITNAEPLETTIYGLALRNMSGGNSVVRVYATGTLTILSCIFEHNHREVVIADLNSCGTVAITDCLFRDNLSRGICGYNATLYLFGCTFENNFTDSKGSCLSLGNSDADITSCLFVGNIGTAIESDSSWGASSHLVVDSCMFDENHGGQGGAICRTGSHNQVTLEITNCVFARGTAEYGGAVYVGGNYLDPFGPARIVNCTFADNAARVGGAVSLFEVGAEFVNCRFSGNVAFEYGGAVYAHIGWPAFRACTVTDNEADGFGGGVYSLGDTMVRSSVLWGNTDRTGSGESAQLDLCCGDQRISYSCVQGWSGTYGGVGNTGNDPLFVGAANGDYRLSAGSPCIDAGDNAAVGRDELDVDGDDCLTELLPVDLDGNARLCDDPAMPDTGYGEAPIIDMGAYEYAACPPPPADPCPLPGDVNCDGVVSFGDINAFVLLMSNRPAWIAGYPDCPITNGDINADSVVGFGDINGFVALLSAGA